MGANFKFWRIWKLTSLGNLVRIERGSFLMLIGTVLSLLALLLLMIGFNLRVNFDTTFCLKESKLLLA